jgi:hypothetical protein
MHIYRDMVKYGMIDVIVATGASIVDMDFFEALGFKHYQAQSNVDDRDLRDLYIDRIYDTYIDEEELQNCDGTIYAICEMLEPRPYSSREFIYEMGKWLAEGNAKKPDSLVETAYREGVPIFCPAFVDSSAGFGLVKHQVERMKAGKPYLTIDAVADFRELTDIKLAAAPRASSWSAAACRRTSPRTPSSAPKSSATKPRCISTRADHRGRRARRRLLVLDAQGGLLLGQGRRHLGADGVRRGHHGGAADRVRRLAPRLLEDPHQAPLGQALRQGGLSQEKWPPPRDRRRPLRRREEFSTLFAVDPDLGLLLLDVDGQVVQLIDQVLEVLGFSWPMSKGRRSWRARR